MMTATARKLDAAALLAGTTPGPWTVGDSLTVYDDNAYEVCHTFADTDEIRAATARLIAAAPDLAARVLELEAALNEAHSLMIEGPRRRRIRAVLDGGTP